MQKDLLAKIDLLIGMSKSTSNIDTLKAELSEIEEELEIKRKELEDLRKSMQDEKYIKASDRIIDENIKVSLELKIQKLENSLKDLEKELEKVLESEEEFHQKKQHLEEKINKAREMSKNLNEKVNSAINPEIKTYYEDLLKENDKRINLLEEDLAYYRNQYEKISNRITELTTQIQKLKSKIASEKEKLNDTKNNLSSTETYIDIKLKKEDEKRLHILEEKVETLEARIEEIQSDAVMIGNEAKELFLEEDYTGSLLKIKQLVSNIKKMPYMDIASINELHEVLKQAEAHAINERDEFASVIETRDYDGNDTEIISEREKYLESQKRELESELENKKAKINEIDTRKIRELSSLLSAANVVGENLKKDLSDYQKVIEESTENITPKKKTVLLAAYNKKEEEQKVVQNIIDAYETEMEELMKESERIYATELKYIESEIERINDALKEIRKKSMISSKAKDILAMENDKAKLKELSETVKEIVEYQKLTNTPSEILDEIELSLGSIHNVEVKVEDVKPVIEEKQDNLLNNFRISADVDIKPLEIAKEEVNNQHNDEETNNSLNVNFDIPWITNTEEIKPIPKEDTLSINIKQKSDELEDIPQVAPINIDDILDLNAEAKEIPTSERFKVINVEYLNEESVKQEDNNTDSVVISDFKDEDYIDFDTFIEGGNI